MKRSTELSLWETRLQGREIFCYLQIVFEDIPEPNNIAIVHTSVRIGFIGSYFVK